MKNNAVVLGMLMMAGGLMASCSSNDDVFSGATGQVGLSVQAETGFTATKAVTESDYTDLINYTVQVLDASNAVAWQKQPGEQLQETLTLPVGQYKVKAFCGEDQAASTTSMYVIGEGELTDVTENGSVTLSATCRPVCAKVRVVLDDKLDEYYSDYSVTFKTAALGSSSFVWSKDATDPVYLKVAQEEQVTATINATAISGNGVTNQTVEKTYTLSPQDGLTLSVALSGDGQMGFNITINEDTNDIEQDIEVPSEWPTEAE